MISFCLMSADLKLAMAIITFRVVILVIGVNVLKRYFRRE